MTRLALVTGGSRGIGSCVVAQLQAAGWDVLAPGRAALDMRRRDEDRFGESLASIHNHIFDLDALVLCHGTWLSGEFWSQWTDDWEDQYQLRVVSSLRLIRAMWRPLERNNGSITVVSSTQAFGGRINTGAYGAACAAQVRMVLGLAQSLEAIRSNVVCPGLSATDMAKEVRRSGDCRPDAAPQPPEAVASVITGLVTDGASNGRVVRVVDGKASDAQWSW